MKEIKIKHDSQPEEIHDFTKGYLTLPFDEGQFGDFITNLLGLPQTLQKKIQGNFELHLKDLQNFYNLVNQRIEQQNKGKLIQFRTTLYFSDGSSVTLGGITELETYNEIKPITCVAAVLTWDYLILFADKTVPEKQTIELLITISNYEKKANEPSLDYIGDIGEFVLTISHTARSWAYDIEHLFSNQINSLINPVNKLKNFIRINSARISVGVLIVYLIISLAGAISAIKFFNLKQVDYVNEFMNRENIDISQKINFLSTYIANGQSAQYYFKVAIFILISIIISITFLVWVSNLAESKEPSFLVVTRQSKKYRDRICKKLERKWLWFSFSIVISIITSLIANFIFTYLIK
ncbi:hypothetical protein EMN47_19235 [Prolixibacteraceae bacterium JC049]|nr:hypothetical protein [Prolixibacteraceae bacterium JC049]